MELPAAVTIVPSSKLPPTVPFTSHVTFVWLVPATVQANVVTPFRGTVTAVGEIVIVMAVLIWTPIDANRDGSATGVAVIVILVGDGAINGAVYVACAPEPTATIVPHAAPVQRVPEMLQEIIGLGFEPAAGISAAANPALLALETADGPLSVSVKCAVSEITTVLFFDGSATLEAINVTVAGEGSACGAVKTPFESTLPQLLSEHPAPLTDHTIAVLGRALETTLA